MDERRDAKLVLAVHLDAGVEDAAKLDGGRLVGEHAVELLDAVLLKWNPNSHA